jgi:transposase
MLTTPEGIPAHIADVLATVEQLHATIEAAKKRIEQATSGHPVCELLMTVPGVGPITAMRYASLVDQVGRFPTAHHLESYLGLTSGERTTGFVPRPTGLTKAGSSAMRRLLIQAAWCAIRTRRGEPMVQWALRIAERRNKKVAVSALARKMAGVLYAIWRDGKPYDPSRAATTNT